MAFTKRATTPQELCAAVWLLVDENLDYFSRIQKVIDPFETNVVYKLEPRALNEFLNVRDMMARGYGDCEDLAAWLIAYFLAIDIQARPVLVEQTSTYYHVIAEAFYDGKWVVIDPSKVKGM